MPGYTYNPKKYDATEFIGDELLGANKLQNIFMQKRIKSFFITASSVIGAALVALVFTPEWASFIVFTHDKLIGLGVPAVIIAVVGVFISEVWKEILNRRTIANTGLIGSVSSTIGNDLY